MRAELEPDGPGRWLWVGLSGRERVFWIRWEQEQPPHPKRMLMTFWEEGWPLDVPYAPSDIKGITHLAFEDGTLFGKWIKKVGDLP